MSLDDSIELKVREAVKGTRFEVQTLTKLAGGTANWIFAATLASPLDDGSSEVLIKHGQGFSASNQNFELPLSRCKIEAESLRLLSGHSVSGSPPAGASNVNVRTPALFDLTEGDDSTIQVQEYLPGSIDLKQYMLKHCAASPTPVEREKSAQIGAALANWLRSFHKWAASQQDEDFARLVSKNTFGPYVKNLINFSWLSDRVDTFPDVLRDCKDLLVEIQDAVAKEKDNQKARYQIIHGDFWTGNIVLPDKPLEAESDGPIFVVDWEIAQFGLPSFDLGQMIAELYALWLYRGNEAALVLMESFIDTYMQNSGLGEDFAFRAALQVGAHLVCITTGFPGWGTHEELEPVVRVGRDILIHAWRRDRAWFEGGKLQGLFRLVASGSSATGL
ncbi:kinase-like domain-containing protein [Plectosphaerella plurivora]|uniref:Kinase-like domain-containing protein n=1 Tax=Plectosphaerella plurivora TaxID=936078 RepID=A0A9P8V149_9PEZI|nr:kinase-like domain-containing protein [Plectosphaerella plurivora]